MRSYNKMMIAGVNAMRSMKVFALGLAVLAACAGDVGDIDRTQPNKISKEIFQGEWFFRPTVVEVQYNQGMLFEGLEGDMERIRWEIRRDHLVAYRSYEILINQEEGNGDQEFNGAPVAVFPISSHFDVWRRYNPATGEQTNEIVENTTDRPWYDREYIRVDWSRNLLNNPYKLEEYVEAIAGAPYYIQGHEEDSAFRPEIGDEVINVVGNYLLTTDIYTCWGVLLDPLFCGGSEAKMRLSFTKISGTRMTDDGRNVLRDYQPLYYPDRVQLRYADGRVVSNCSGYDGECSKETETVFERFGYFRHERLAYDKEYLWTRDGRVFLGHRHNIWARSFDKDGNVIAPEYRQPGKVIYYKTADYPTDADIMNASAQIASDWDTSFRTTVLLLKQRANPTLTLADIPQIFELRENSCSVDNVNKWLADHAGKVEVEGKGTRDLREVLSGYGITDVQRGNFKRACAILTSHPVVVGSSVDRFTWEQLGDLRYSFFNWVDRPQLAGPLGYGPSAADPVTGEIISGTANLYGAAVDEYASFAADIISVMNGDLELEDVVEGENIRDHIEETRKRLNEEISGAKMQQAHQKMFESRSHAFGSQVPKARRTMFDRTLEAKPLPNEGAVAQQIVAADPDAGFDKLIGTYLEREYLMNDDLKRVMAGPQGFNPMLGVDDTEGMSPIEYMIGDTAAVRKDVLQKLSAHSICMMEPMAWADSGMAMLAKQLEGKSYQEVYDYMRREMYRSVMAHEVGHTLGLRHNFGGSFDALNFHPEFWDSFDATKQEVVRLDNDGEPTTAEQYMYSSIMDYDARFYADSVHGIGPYDNAAIKFGYGGLLETFQNGVAPMWYDTLLWLHGYQALPKIFSGDLTCTQTKCDPDLLEAFGAYNDYSDAAQAAEAAQQAGDDATWEQKQQEADDAYEQFNRYLLTYFRDGPTRVTAGTGDVGNLWKRDHIRFDDLMELWTNYYETGSYDIPDVVPYEFCSDEIVGYGRPECAVYDKGASYTEVTRDRMERYDSYYYFSNFKRDRAGFNDYDYIGSYLGRLYDRYFEPMGNMFRYAMYGTSEMGRDKTGKKLTLADFPVGQNWEQAGHEGLNFLAQVVEQPEPGTYCKEQASDLSLVGTGETCSGTATTHCRAADGSYAAMGVGDTCASGFTKTLCNATYEVYRPQTSATCASGDTIEVPLGIGKHYLTKWTDEYNYKATRIGTFWDKYAATFAMTDNQGFFYRDFASYFDVGAFQLSYWSGGLQDQVLDFFQGQWSGSTGKYAWRFDDTRAGLEKFRPAPVSDIYVDSVNPSLPRLESAFSYTMQWYTVALPLVRFNSMFDYTADFLNYSRICLDGYVDCLSYDGDWGQVDYIDPLTGYTYVAPLSDKPGKSIAARMLEQADAYKVQVYEPAKLAYDANPEGAQEQLDLAKAEAELNRQGGFLDTVREFSGAIGGEWR